MSDLKKQLVKLGSMNPELRQHIRPVLDTLTCRSPQLSLRDSIGLTKMARLESNQSLHSYVVEGEEDFSRLFFWGLAKSLGLKKWQILKGDLHGEYLGIPMIFSHKLTRETHGYQLVFFCESKKKVVRALKHTIRYVGSPQDSIQELAPKIKDYVESLPL